MYIRVAISIRLILQLLRNCESTSPRGQRLGVAGLIHETVGGKGNDPAKPQTIAHPGREGLGRPEMLENSSAPGPVA